MLVVPSPESPLRIEFLPLQALSSRRTPKELPMPGVRDAAVALIGVAPEATVLTVLRMLVDAVTPAPARAPEALSPPATRVVSPRPKPATAAPIDEGWEELRRQVKVAMAEHGASYGDIAQSIGRSEIGTRITINTRKPPKPIVRTRLQIWLDQAPAVASPAVPFPGSGTGHRGNGRDITDGPYSSRRTGHVSAA
jgi:hypothetical protein